MLHITNGDSAATSILVARRGEQVLPWRDVLHEGPVPDGLPLEELSAIRAAYIAARGWAHAERVGDEFRRRDGTLAECRDHDEIVLWFEHDLYDQLQLIQVLDWFDAHWCDVSRLTLICVDSFPGVERFVGLGQLAPAQLAELFSSRAQVTREHAEAASLAWAAFRSPDPSALSDLTNRSVPGLPFLASAIARFIEEYPSTRDGLGRTEVQILQAIANGHQTREAIFTESQAMETRPFMGDTTLWSRIADLESGLRPLVRSHNGQDTGAIYELTETGKGVLSGKLDAIALNGIDRWFGGVHLDGSYPTWRRDGERLVALERASPAELPQPVARGLPSSWS